MARLPRIVLPNTPHHVTQRGNRRQKLFSKDGDYALYRDLLAESCHRERVSVWSYCLMPNHVHLIMTPETSDGLGRALGEAHRRYTGYVNARDRVTGHLFQGRFGSVAMDEDHLIAAIRYVALNPVSAKLVRGAQDWKWSSVRAHMICADDELASVTPVSERIPDFRDFLKSNAEPEALARLLKGQSIGRPLMDTVALKKLEKKLKRRLLPLRRGPKP